MTDYLAVDTGGLGTAAAGSVDIAAALTVGAGDSGAPGGQPSHAGASAIDGALSAMLVRQSGRVGEQASDMSTGSSQYGNTDGRSAADLAESM